MTAIKGEKIRKTFGAQTVFEDASFLFPNHGLCLLLGESGIGKSTLLDIFSGIDVDYGGSVSCYGREYKKCSDAERGAFRYKNIGFLRQEFDLLPHESVLSNAILPLECEKGISEKEKKIKAKVLLKDVGLYAKRKSLAYTLSGGEKQRLAFVRSIIHDPAILLCDEPTGALDKESASRIVSLLEREAKSRLVIVSTHDEEAFKPVANAVYRIENRKITCKNRLSFDRNPKKEIRIKSGKAGISFRFWIKHALNLLKARRFRTSLSIFLMSFSLTMLGLSVFLKRDVSEKIESSLTSLTGEGMVVMSLKNDKSASLSNVLSAPKKEVSLIASKKDDGSAVCASYLSSFEQIFKTTNEMYIKYGARRYSFSSLSARSINDFLCLDDYHDAAVFPSRPAILETDDIVLGLPQNAMHDLAKAFQTERNYDALGTFLTKKRLSLDLAVENADWGYSDKQSFFIKGVMEFRVPTIFHFERLWNEKVFEEMMLLPSSDGSSFKTPWTLHKVYGLSGIKDEERFLSSSRNEDMRRYVFDKDAYRYDQSHNEGEIGRKDVRYFLFSANRFGIKESDVSSIASSREISSFSFLGEGAYRAFASAFSYGFKEPFLLGNDMNEVTQYADALSKVPRRMMASFPDTPLSLALGSYLRPRISGLTFSSDFSSIISGSIPKSIDEIVLSSALYDRLGKPKEVAVGGVYEVSADEENVYRNYRFATLKVVGVSSLNFDVMVGDSYWLIDFFKARLGMSAFSLEARECLFQIKEGTDPSNVVSVLDAKYPNYSFADPSSAISESVSQVMGYISAILLFASVSCVIAGFILLLSLSTLYVSENKSEGRYFYLLGIGKNDIADGYISGVALLLTIGLLVSFLSLFVVEILFDEAISSSFGVVSSFQMDLLPHFIVFLAYVISLLFVSIFVKAPLRKNDLAKRENA